MALSRQFRSSCAPALLARLLVFVVLAMGSSHLLPAQIQPSVAGTPGSATPPNTSPRATAPSTRTIQGLVLDVKGAPVPGAAVLLKDTKTLQVRSYLAGKDGSYHFFGLSTEVNYELRAQANGMTSPQKTVSVFDSHKVVKLNLKLKKKLKA